MQKKRIYVFMSGRCGNQLFQYAYGRALQEKNKADLYLDYTWYDLEDSKMVEDGYRNVLEDFNVSDYYLVTRRNFDYKLFGFGQLSIKTFLSKTYNYLSNRNRYLANISIYIFERLFSIPLQILFGLYFIESANSKWLHLPPMPWHRTIVIRGFFESSDYSKDIINKIRKEFTPKLKIKDDLVYLGTTLSSCNSVCVSIRRGDFLSNSFGKIYNICDKEYFFSAVSYLKSKLSQLHLFVCSDDLEWCIENIKVDGVNLIFEPKGLSLSEKLYLMSKCNHFILSNSTFSWWAQALSMNSEKIVVAPSVWRREFPAPKDIYDNNWHVIDVNNV